MDNSHTKHVVALITVESRSTEDQQNHGYHDFLTTIEGSQAAHYARLELERLKPISMWAQIDQSPRGPEDQKKIFIRHGYDSGD